MSRQRLASDPVSVAGANSLVGLSKREREIASDHRVDINLAPGTDSISNRLETLLFLGNQSESRPKG